MSLEAFECPFCGALSAAFLPFGQSTEVCERLGVIGAGCRPNALCPRCFSTDRERLVYLYLRTTSLFYDRAAVLHVAPERCLSEVLRASELITYRSIDRNPLRGQQCMDLTNLRFRRCSFDYVICNHVLEHIVDDWRALSEIRRVLKHSGSAVLQVPIAPGLERTYEDSTVTDGRERLRCFGQADHVRIYGRDYASRLAAAGFVCDMFMPATELGLECVRRHALLENEVVFVARPRARSWLWR
jgi:SAM-dependent methyltransferase